MVKHIYDPATVWVDPISDADGRKRFNLGFDASNFNDANVWIHLHAVQRILKAAKAKMARLNLIRVEYQGTAGATSYIDHADLEAGIARKLGRIMITKTTTTEFVPHDFLINVPIGLDPSKLTVAVAWISLSNADYAATDDMLVHVEGWIQT